MLLNIIKKKQVFGLYFGQDDSEDGNEQDDFIIERVAKQRRATESTDYSGYPDKRLLLPTWDLCKRCFSIGG